MHHNAVKRIAVNHEESPPVCGRMNDAVKYLDVAETVADESAKAVIVVAGQEDDPGTAPGVFEQFMHDFVVEWGPPPAFPKRFHVNDVADEIQEIASD
jgi:hypothetical protein